MKYLLVLMLTGCSATIPGVHITEQEKERCKLAVDAPFEQQCSVWSPEELKELAINFYKRGYLSGRSGL